MNQTKVLTDTMTFSASVDREMDLPTEALITRIDLEMYLDMSGDISSNAATLAHWRPIQNLKIQGGGGKNYFSMAGVHMGILLHHLNLLDFPGLTWRDVAAETQYVCFRLHFGSRPRDIYGRDNPFDLTAAIPAMNEKTLKLIWTCSANDACDDTETIDTTTTIRATVHQVLGGEAAWSKMVPISSSEAYDPLATKDALSGKLDIPTGNFVRRIAIMAQNETGVGSFGPYLHADQATELGVKLVKENRQLIYIRTKSLEVCGSPIFDGGSGEDSTDNNTPNVQQPFTQQGLYCLDLRQYGDRDYGVDTRGMKDGDLELGFTIGAYTSNDTEMIWYDQLQRLGG